MAVWIALWLKPGYVRSNGIFEKKLEKEFLLLENGTVGTTDIVAKFAKIITWNNLEILDMSLKRNRLDAGYELEPRVMLSGSIPGAEAPVSSEAEAPVEETAADDAVATEDAATDAVSYTHLTLPTILLV